MKVSFQMKKNAVENELKKHVHLIEDPKIKDRI